MNKSRYAMRRARNVTFLTLSVCAAGFGLMWLSAILFTLLTEGAGGLSPDLFTGMTPPPGEKGGLANAIFGSVLMSTIAVVIGTPIGIMAGTYLAEYGRHTRTAQVTRFVNDI